MKQLKDFFTRRRIYSDLSDEIEQHIQEKIEELVAGGMSRGHAQAAARREFGNAAQLQERSREVWHWGFLEDLFRDARFACRQLRRNPGFTFTVVLTLTLALGANTAVFSMVNALLLRPLPYPQPERLAAVTRHLAGVMTNGQPVDESDDGQDGETWELVRDGVPSALAAAYSAESNGVNVEANHQVRYLQDQRVSATFFDVLGIKPLLGRGFTQEEDRPKGPNAAILSYGLWQSMFSADRNIPGQAIRLKGEPYTVVGVMPPGVQTTAHADLWTPLQPWRRGEGAGINYRIVMRLHDGATWSQVNSQLLPLHPALFDKLLKGAKRELVAKPFQRDLAEEKLDPTLILMSAVGLILLIAAANLAGLALVRMSRRSNEIATRLALGAPRAAVIRQAFMEPLLLTLAGAVAGVALAVFGLKYFAGVFPTSMLPLGGVSIDLRVLAFALLCTAGASLFIGIFPALATGKVRIGTSFSNLKSTADHGGRSRQVLIACEVCLTLVLLAGAGLLIRTLTYLQRLPPGFDATDVLTGKASLDDSRYHDPAVFQKLVQESLTGMTRIPGIESAAVGLSLPYERGLNDVFKVLDGPRAGTQMASSTAYVSPEYFHTLRIPVLAGRAFAESDTSTSEPVTIVNASFARQHMGTLDVIGLHLGLGESRCTVVGLVGDVKKPPGININAPLSTEPMYYVPYTQVSQSYLKLIHVWFEPSWIVRSTGPIAGLPEAMQKALATPAPSLPFSGFYRLADLQDLALSQQRVEGLLLTVLASLAFVLSIVGVYGLVSNVVVQQRREIGIRMALGSTLPRAMRSVASSGMTAAIMGLCAGLILATFVLRIMRNELYGVRSLDPATLIAVSVFLFSAALLASLAPTLRIAKIDPASTLRAE
jgi:predicted permease